MMRQISKRRQSREPEHDVVYLTPAVKEEWLSLYGQVPVFHVSQKTFAELESVTNIGIHHYYAGANRTAIAIVVDDVFPETSRDGPPASARTEALLLDTRSEVWRFYERTSIPPSDAAGESQIVGAVWLPQKRLYTSAGAHALGYWTGNEFRPWELHRVDTERIIRTSLAFLWLLWHDEISVSEPVLVNGQDHVIVDVPNHLSAEQAIADLLSGQHMKRRPSRIGRFIRAALRMPKKRQPTAHTATSK